MNERVCPRCGNNYYEYPAISRLDNKTEICPTCGQAEALEQYAFGYIKDWRNKNK